MAKINKQQLEDLMARYVSGHLSAKEKLWLENWFYRESQRVEFDEENGDYLQLKYAIWEETLKKAGLPNPEIKMRNPLWPKLMVAASVVIALTAGIWFYTSRQSLVKHNIPIASQHDIAPGTNRATLTLGNGNELELSDAKTGLVIDASKLVYNDGSAISGSKSTVGKETRNSSTVHTTEMKLVTPKGGQYIVTLPDGTKVWLNAASSLKFPSSFVGAAQRKVELIGEAYFEVAKDKKHPFMVKTEQQEVEVLGTHFNIYCYPNEQGSKTTLLEGKVKVNKHTVLKPDEQAVIEKGELTVKQVDAEEEVAWKDGYFSFSNANIKNVMTQLSKWYDVDVVYEGEPSIEGFNAKISRSKNISQVLNMLERTKSIQFKIEGRRVIVIQ